MLILHVKLALILAAGPCHEGDSVCRIRTAYAVQCTAVYDDTCASGAGTLQSGMAQTAATAIRCGMQNAAAL